LARFKSLLINLAVFALVAVGGGLGSAWYMIEAGSELSTRSVGPWTAWTAAGRSDADPYTRAHIARDALLPISSTLEVTYKARTDSRGGKLNSACDYALVVEGLDNAWWSLAAFDTRGRLIANAAERYDFTSDTVMREPDGRAIITLARDARPGNWLPIGGGGRFVLILTLEDAALASAAYEGAPGAKLPTIERVACR
jgi:hypothetical protein